MTGEPIITVTGNLTADPELRFTPSGAAVANFTVASTPRSFNKQTSEWDDGEALFMRCSIWREYAENVAESLSKGARVIVTGRLISRSWEDKDSGQKRTVMEMQVDEVGPALRYATARVTKAERQGGQQQAQQGGQQGGGWGQPQQAQQGGWGQPQEPAPQWAQQPAQGQQQAQQGPPPQQQPNAAQQALAQQQANTGQQPGWGATAAGQQGEPDPWATGQAQGQPNQG